MQISGHGRSNELAQLLLGIQDRDRSAARPQAQAAASQDSIRISQDAQELQRIKALTQASDPARAERVERIRRSIESGTYSPDSKATADALIRHVLTDSVL
jgi:negative regulator of flagellin synthesis FlgM